MTKPIHIKTNRVVKTRLAAILFILTLGALSLSAQEARQRATEPVLQKTTVIKSAKAYTVHAAKNFPMLQEAQKNDLAAMDDSELVIDDTLLLAPGAPENEGSSKTVAMVPPKFKIAKKPSGQ